MIKLLIITAVKSYEEQIKEILKANNVATYSYNNVVGYRDSTLDSVSENWFGTEMNKGESLMFFAFMPEVTSNNLFEDIEKFNEKNDVKTKIHVFIAPIEKSNTK